MRVAAKKSVLHVCFTVFATCSILWCSCKRGGGSEGEPKVKIELRVLRDALRFYEIEYGVLPVQEPRTQEQDNAIIVNILRAEASEELLSKFNAKRRVFLQVPSASLVDGAFLDPWAHPYHIYFDVNGKSKITVGDQIIPARIAIWSNGFNGIDEHGGGDDVCSWKDL
jgi:hypothetical protein